MPWMRAVSSERRARDRAGEERLAGARDVLDEHVPIGEQRDRDQAHRLLAADDRPPDGAAQVRPQAAPRRDGLLGAGAASLSDAVSDASSAMRGGSSDRGAACTLSWKPTRRRAAGFAAITVAEAATHAVSSVEPARVPSSRSIVSLPSLARIPAPPDPILGLAEAYRTDTRERKINLSSGVFVDETGTTPVLPTVIEAERRLADAAGTKLYRPIDGEPGYRELVRALVLGRRSRGGHVRTRARDPDAGRHGRPSRRGRPARTRPAAARRCG